MFASVRKIARLSPQIYSQVMRYNVDLKSGVSPYFRAGSCRLCHTGEVSSSHIIQMRGFDFETTEEDVIGYFRPLSITPVKVHLPRDISGRTAGVCEVEFASHADAVKAMRKKNAYMGNRYIRLTHKTSSEVSKESGILETVSFMNANDINVHVIGGMTTTGNFVLRMRNVPPRVTESTIYHFFMSADVRPVSIKPVYDDLGCRTDEVELVFSTEEEAMKAMCKNHSRLGHRNVELYSPTDDDDNTLSKGQNSGSSVSST